MIKVNIAGVPEHFNLPWHLAIEEGAFEDRGIDLVWNEVPEGTGRMCQMLRNGDTDIAIILTEGIIKDITEGNPSKIIQKYIESPLLWGIHVGSKSAFNSLNDLEKGKVAISRYGSGSHLMAYVNAKNQGWNVDELQFEVINNLNGAIEALTNGTADYFMWEHFTTKPIVDEGIFNRVGDCPTPWPCFVIAVSDQFNKENHNIVNHILEVINSYTTEFKDIPSIDRTIANRYNQQLTDIQKWLSITQWSQSQISEAMIDKVQHQLLELNLINDKLPFKKLTF
ncbi:ABC-type nitrate/sulfonate/bicarbonate transport system, substrate-binding protein [Zhouia amylolytica]|uniref:Ca3427-like PBP 2 domain-containing protein n=2 Tax=Zhouia amylolytica TaxID=376730 RepID=W2UMR4_9FLAO|nr:substrate-binding domain-containing protein [Zhouia amylolytica]ETN95455.1 hypothetical protein P278_11770 [Zhouia amylolytica AD3]MCQ0112697.1 ABC transporter substrate-binding protein [Zhouia amylolytica]SFT02061.1 ABC-type nitrate/sulfonate/bicarbonate transport system, substrate-binding protein [Zhouia amylolytica]